MTAVERDAQANGLHLIAARMVDGSLVVGDGHYVVAAPDPVPRGRSPSAGSAPMPASRVVDD